MRVHLSRPDITEKEIAEVTAVLRTPNLAFGPKLPEFEQAFAKYIGREEGAIYRFRIGNYRIFCETSGKTTRILMILSIKNRKDAYK